MLIPRGLPRSDPLVLWMLKAQEVATNTCIDSSMLCATVASPCQTLRELLAADTNSPTHQLAVPPNTVRAYTTVYTVFGHAHTNAQPRVSHVATEEQPLEQLF